MDWTYFNAQWKFPSSCDLPLEWCWVKREIGFKQTFFIKKKKKSGCVKCLHLDIHVVVVSCIQSVIVCWTALTWSCWTHQRFSVLVWVGMKEGFSKQQLIPSATVKWFDLFPAWILLYWLVGAEGGGTGGSSLSFLPVYSPTQMTLRGHSLIITVVCSPKHCHNTMAMPGGNTVSLCHHMRVTNLEKVVGRCF